MVVNWQCQGKRMILTTAHEQDSPRDDQQAIARALPAMDGTMGSGDDAIQFEVTTPERVHRFLAAQAKNYKAPTSLGTVVAALRGPARLLPLACDAGRSPHALVGALAYPANWQLASLPKSLEPAEVEQLDGALGQSGPSMLRVDAMVRFMLDLGLRSGEVARLSLDDIDWDVGTITPYRSSRSALAADPDEKDARRGPIR
jgi:integrase